MAETRGLARRLLRQVVQGQQHEDRGHHLDRELGQGQVRGREIDEGQGHHQAHDAGQDQRQQAMPMPDDDATAGRQHQQPERHRGDIGHEHRPVALAVRAAQEGREAHGQHDQDRDQQATLQRAVVDGVGEPAGGADGCGHAGLEHVLGFRPRQPQPVGADRPVARQQQHAAGEGHGGHEHGGRQPVPQGQVIFGQGAADHGGGCHVDHRLDQARGHADQQHRDDQHRHGQPHPGRRVVRVVRVVVTGPAEKDLEHEAEGIGHG